MNDGLQPLRLHAGWSVVFHDFTEYDPERAGEGDAFCLHEDLLQLRHERAGLVIDLGWYPDGDRNGRYVLLLVRGQEWDAPLERAESRSRDGIAGLIGCWTDEAFWGRYGG